MDVELMRRLIQLQAIYRSILPEVIIICLAFMAVRALEEELESGEGQITNNIEVVLSRVIEIITT